MIKIDLNFFIPPRIISKIIAFLKYLTVHDSLDDYLRELV